MQQVSIIEVKVVLKGYNAAVRLFRSAAGFEFDAFKNSSPCAIARPGLRHVAHDHSQRVEQLGLHPRLQHHQVHVNLS
jgi:hypothetical protein